METRVKNLAANNVDPETEYLYRYVRSETEGFGAHYHDYYEIFLTLSDGLTHTVNGVKTKLADGELVFVRDFDYHLYACKKPSSFVNIAFSAATFDSLTGYLGEGFPCEKLLAAKMPPTVMLESNDKKRLLDEFSELNTVNFNDKQMLKTRFRILLTDIFARYFMNINTSEMNNIPYWLERCCEKMKQPQNFICGTERMFDLSQKSREHTTRSLQKYYGMSPSEYVNKLRINYAANLLSNSNLSVTDICYECGFGNMSWFYELFRDKYGMTPRQFRADN